MEIKKLWFHVKWIFKKRYQIVFGYDSGIKGKDKIVCMRHDRKKNTFKVIL